MIVLGQSAQKFSPIIQQSRRHRLKATKQFVFSPPEAQKRESLTEVLLRCVSEMLSDFQYEFMHMKKQLRERWNVWWNVPALFAIRHIANSSKRRKNMKWEKNLNILFHPSHHPKNGNYERNELNALWSTNSRQRWCALILSWESFSPSSSDWTDRSTRFIIILYFVNFIHVVQHLLLFVVIFCVTSRWVNKT